MIADIIYQTKSKTIEDVIALDPFGYDRGFILKFTDGEKIIVEPDMCLDQPRVSIKKEK